MRATVPDFQPGPCRTATAHHAVWTSAGMARGSTDTDTEFERGGTVWAADPQRCRRPQVLGRGVGVQRAVV